MAEALECKSIDDMSGRKALGLVMDRLNHVRMMNSISILQMGKANETIFEGGQFPDSNKRLERLQAVLGFRVEGLIEAMDVINHLLDPNYQPKALPVDYLEGIESDSQLLTESEARSFADQPMLCADVRKEYFAASNELGAPLGLTEVGGQKNG